MKLMTLAMVLVGYRQVSSLHGVLRKLTNFMMVHCIL